MKNIDKLSVKSAKMNNTEEQHATERNELPQISIIVPVYNTEAYLEDCISSILNQTFSGFELILVNDGSTDHSQKICEKACMEDERVQLLTSPERKGVSHARNLGLEVAVGNYICFQDSDDRMHPMLLECMFKEAQKTNVDLVMADHWISFYLKDTTWEKLCARPVKPDWDIWSENNIWDSWFSSGMGGTVWAKLFLKKSISDLRFDEKTNRSEDWLFNYQFLVNAPRRIAVTKFRGYYHLEIPNGLSHCAPFQEFLSSMKVKQYVRDQELQASRERNALLAEEKIILGIRNWISTNVKEAAANRNELLPLLHRGNEKSPLFRDLPQYEKWLLYLSVYALPLYQTLKETRNHILRFFNSLRYGR